MIWLLLAHPRLTLRLLARRSRWGRRSADPGLAHHRLPARLKRPALDCLPPLEAALNAAQSAEERCELLQLWREYWVAETRWCERYFPDPKGRHS